MVSLNDIAPGTWNIDADHTEIGFVARHLAVTKVKGRFTDVSVNAEVADARVGQEFCGLRGASTHVVHSPTAP